jgi:hypothetical protein
MPTAKVGLHLAGNGPPVHAFQAEPDKVLAAESFVFATLENLAAVRGPLDRRQACADDTSHLAPSGKHIGTEDMERCRGTGGTENAAHLFSLYAHLST